MQQASGIKPSELKKMVDMLQVRWQSLLPSSGRAGPGGAESSGKGEGRASRVWDCHYTGTMRKHRGEAVPWHTLLPLPANWLNPAKWILFFWPQPPALSNGQPEAVPLLLAASYIMAWRPFLITVSAQPHPGWIETHRHSRISALRPEAKDTQLSSGKEDSRDVVLLMEWEQ